jgi:branched-chain amino acid transport system substrate-binding protein
VNLRALLLFSVLIASGCRGASREVIIGAAGPWGDWSGEMTRKGIELAIAQINDSGWVPKKQRLQLRALDDSADGARATIVARQFVEDPAVVGVIGHVTSGAMVAAAKVYDGHLAAIATTATSPDLTGISPWVFRVSTSDAINGRELARFAAQLGRKRAAIIYENDSYGRGLAEAFRKAFPGEVVSLDPIAADLADAEPYIAYYKRRAPDVIFAVGLEVSGLKLLREARRQRLSVDIVGGDGWTGILADTIASDGVYIGTTFIADDPRARVQQFVRDFRARYKTDPDMNAAAGYDATYVLARAIAAVGRDRAAIRRYLATIPSDAPYDGVTGRIRFGADGDPATSPYRVARVSRGALRPADHR